MSHIASTPRRNVKPAKILSPFPAKISASCPAPPAVAEPFPPLAPRPPVLIWKSVTTEDNVWHRRKAAEEKKK
jgi:hypothetical protein